MPQSSPDYTIANNSHCFVHCGPIGPESIDDGRDLTIITSTDSQVVYGKSGNKVEHIMRSNYETCGHQTDPEENGGIARSICAKNGDIALIAENGSIRLKAKNIYIETSGPSGSGNILASANGQIILATGDQIKLAGGKNVCIHGEGGVTISSPAFIKNAGKVIDGGSASTGSLISSVLAGNWGSILQGLSNSCK